jgi:two-component system, sensor histidine kinase and response regulator
MDDFLSKPYSARDLEPILDRWVNPAPDAGSRPEQAGQTTSARPSNPAQGILDPGTITQLRSLDSAGGDSIVHKIFGIFVETTPPQLEKLRIHVASEDCTGISFVAHSLKTASANVAALALSEQFRALESAAQENDIETCRRISAGIADMYEEVVAALRQESKADISNRRTG